MRIALLSYEYPPQTGFGGIGTYTWYHARALAALGHDVHVFAGSVEEGVWESEHEGVRVTRTRRLAEVDGLNQRLRGRKLWWASNRIETAVSAYAGLSRAAAEQPFDVVEYPECGADGALVSTLLEIPAVVRFHSPARLIMEHYETERSDRILTGALEDVGIQQARARTSCSRFLAERASSQLGVTEPIEVIPNGIDLELFDRGEDVNPSKWGLPRAGRRIFFANRIEPRKGSPLLLPIVEQVLTRFPDVRFVFAGRDLFGQMADEILPALRDRGLADRCHHVGALDLAEVRALLRTADAFLLSSIWESCPYSCLEAMSAGVPVVSSDCGGMPELVTDGETGLLASNGDPDSFVEALTRLLSDESSAQIMGRSARRRVEREYTAEATARRSLEVYAALAAPAEALA
jgi:glycosyltransferase involved in cell wall biosynthesis